VYSVLRVGCVGRAGVDALAVVYELGGALLFIGVWRSWATKIGKMGSNIRENFGHAGLFGVVAEFILSCDGPCPPIGKGLSRHHKRQELLPV
jgi:hypothetical protein